MISFPLQTDTERKLYIEALFVCMSRGVISPARGATDLVELALQWQAPDLAAATRQTLLQRVEGILAAYESGAIDRPVAAANFEALFVWDDIPSGCPTIGTPGFGRGEPPNGRLGRSRDANG